MSVKEDERSIDSNYSVYNYFREKPSVLFTIITVVVSFLSFVASTVIINVKMRYYSYWGFDGINLNQTNKTNVSLLFVIIIGCTILFAGYYFIATTIEVFIKNVRHYSPSFKDVRKTRKEIKSINKEIQGGNNNEKTESLSTRLSNIKIKNKKAWKDLMFIIFYCFYEVVKICILTLLCFVIIACLFFEFIPVYVEFKSFFHSTVRVAFIWVLISLAVYTLLFLCFTKRGPERDMEDADEFRNKAKALFLEFPLIKTKHYKLRDYLSNSNIRVAIKVCVSCFLLLLVVIPILLGQILIKYDKSFDIANYNNEIVVVIARDNNYYYCNNAIINDETIYISIDEHIILPKEYLFIKHYDFINVIRIDGYLDQVVIVEDS